MGLTKLWLLTLKNDHKVCGICIRDSGTNLSTRERGLLLLVYFYLAMAMSAIMFGVEFHHAYSEIFWMILIVFFSFIPMFILKRMLKKSRPKSFKPYTLIAEEFDRILSSQDADGSEGVVKQSSWRD